LGLLVGIEVLKSLAPIIAQGIGEDLTIAADGAPGNRLIMHLALHQPAGHPAAPKEEHPIGSHGDHVVRHPVDLHLVHHMGVQEAI